MVPDNVCAHARRTFGRIKSESGGPVSLLRLSGDFAIASSVVRRIHILTQPSNAHRIRRLRRDKAYPSEFVAEETDQADILGNAQLCHREYAHCATR